MYSVEMPSINENVEFHKVDGRSGSLTERTGTYDDRVFKYGFDLKRERNESLEDFSDRLFYVEEVLSDCIGKDLVYFSNKNYKYVVKNIKIDATEDTLCHDIQLEITCEPFRYLSFEDTILLTKPQSIFYKGSVPGECKIKIYGNGNVQLTINRETLEIRNIDEFIEIDSKLVKIINKVGNDAVKNTNGNFLILSRGTNNIDWIGNVKKVEILPRTAFK